MNPYLALFARGWLQVSLVAFSTVAIARGDYPASAMSGFLISLVWFFNARAAGRDTARWEAAVSYALGATCGTLTGMVVGRWLAG